MSKKAMWNEMESVLPIDRASVFFDGIFTDPQLNHPEGIAIDRQGNIWCGGERGEIFRIDPEGRHIELIASTGGFTLGLAFDSLGHLYSCDLKHRAVFRLNTKTRQLIRFADGDRSGNQIRIPNVPVVDERRRCLYVSDSYASDQAGPGIWRFDLETGHGSMWYDQALHFANGLVLNHEGDALYVAETFGRQVCRIPILADGSPGEKQVITQVESLPDGLALDAQGRIYISCYEPSLILRWSEESQLELLYYDQDAHMLCHPTNCVLHGNDLFISNLGRWHITKIANVI